MYMKHPALPPTYPVCYAPLTILLAAGAAVSAISAISQGQAASRQAKIQAITLEQQAESERQRAAGAEEDFRRNQSRAMARRRAVLGASGVQQATGSPLLAGEDFAGEVELQALRVRQGGEVRATRLQQQAALQRVSGRVAARGGFLRAGSLLLTGAGRAFS